MKESTIMNPDITDEETSSFTSSVIWPNYLTFLNVIFLLSRYIVK